MAEMMDGIWELVEVLKSTPETPRANTTYATVTRVDKEGTVWVHIPGGAEETPANGLNVATVEPGDVVGISIAGNQANVTGNATAPAVSEREVVRAVEPVRTISQEAVQAAESAEKVAEAAQAVAEATGQHFWDADDGAHITEVTKDEWNDPDSENYHAGANSLWNSLGMLFRKGLNNLLAIVTGETPGLAIYDGQGNEASNIIARFNADRAQLGSNGGAHSVIDADGQRFYANDGSTQLANIGYGEGRSTSGTKVSPYYTLGIRLSGVAIGNYSLAQGFSVEASGYYSHAEGGNTRAIGGESHAEGQGSIANGLTAHAEGYLTHAKGRASHSEGQETWASGDYSHAQNYNTQATRKSQTALGEYNIVDTGGTDETTRGDYAVIVGNGTSSMARSNALTVDWSGNVEAAGDVTDGGGNVLADKVDTTALAEVATSGDYDDLTNQPTIPTATSELTNDSGFIDLNTPMVITKYVDVATGTISHGGNSSVMTVDCPTQTGYEPIGIAGFDQTGNSSRNNWIVPWRWFLSNNQVTVRFCNHHASDSAYTTYRIYITYIRTA